MIWAGRGLSKYGGYPYYHVDAEPRKNHHYIPAFYLRRWENTPENKLTEFTKVGKPCCQKLVHKRVMAESTGFERKLYTLEGCEPEHAQQVETDYFSPLDNRASEVLSTLETLGSKAIGTSIRRTRWTRFLVSLSLRCPEDIEGLRDWWRRKIFDGASAETEEQYARQRTPEDPESFGDYARSQPISKVDQRMFRAFCRLIGGRARRTVINNMEWRVLEAPEPAPTLLTSDRPLIQTSSFVDAKAHIMLPIGPRKLFVASPDRAYLDCLMKVSRTTLVKQVNRQVVESARRFVWGCNDHQKSFIEKHFGRTPQPGFFERLHPEARTTPSVTSLD